MISLNDIGVEICLPEPHHYEYEEKLVAYIDIIGWENATRIDTINGQVKEALIILDDIYKYSSPAFRAQMEQAHGPEGNPIYKGIEVGLFSDGLLVTMTPEHGAGIFSIANVCRELLAIGFLCRGGITKGYCYHKDNRVFGPAINEVVDLEKKAKMPRVLLDSGVMGIANSGYLDAKFSTVDSDGENVLNLFQNYYPRYVDISTIEDSLKVLRIRQNIQKEVEKFSTSPSEKYQKCREKWEYAKLLVEMQLSENIYI